MSDPDSLANRAVPDRRRRAFLLAMASGLGGALAPKARAQGPVKRVGIIGRPGGLVLTAWKERFPPEFRAHGFTEGANLLLAWHSVPMPGEGDPPVPGTELKARARKTVAEMVAAGYDCLVARQEVDTRLMLEATRTIPIVTADVPDPVGAGFAKSLARPGGNVTGVHLGMAEVALKTIEMHRTLVRGLSGFAWIGWSNFREQARPFEAAARELGMRFRLLPIETVDSAAIAGLEGAFAALRRDGFGAAHSVIPAELHEAAARAALRHRVALSGPYAGSHGILLAYAGAALQEPERRVPAIVSRILQGERPGDIPFEGPARYELAVNVATAGQLGIDLPGEVLLRAERVFR